MKQLDEVEVAPSLPEVLFQDDEDGRFQHEGVVDGDHADLRHAVPAWTPSARLGRVHDVVADEEERLQQLRTPSQRRRVSGFVTL